MRWNRVWTGWVLCVAALAGCRTPPPERQDVACEPPQRQVLTEGERSWGPLSHSHPVAPTSWPDRQKARTRNDACRVGEQGIRDDMAILMAVLGEAFVPRTEEQQEALDFSAQHAEIVQRLAPYAVESIQNAVHNMGQRVGFCSHAPLVSYHCDPDLEETARPAHDRPYQVLSSEEGFATLALFDLSDGAGPGWQSFAADVAPLATAKGVIVDMRHARGTDPRPLLSWIGELTKAGSLAPLQQVRERPSLAQYVQAYQAQYLTEARDPELWRGFVGDTSPPEAAATLPPIVVVVGGQCGAGCELVARVLETYGRATVVGGVGPLGRVARDDPAFLYLPASGIRVYFYATEYVLSEEIERATGLTHAWASAVDPLDYDGMGYALEELRYRAQSPGGAPPQCDGAIAFERANALPEGAREKIVSSCASSCTLSSSDCTDPSVLHEVVVETEIPLSALRRFVSTCGTAAQVRSMFPGHFQVSTRADWASFVGLVSQLAQSELIERIQLLCREEVVPTPDWLQ